MSPFSIKKNKIKSTDHFLRTFPRGQSRDRSFRTIFRRWRLNNPIIFPLLDRQTPSLILQTLCPQCLITVQTNHRKVAILKQQTFFRLSMVPQKRKVLHRKSSDSFSIGGYATYVATIIMSVVLPIRGVDLLTASQRFVSAPLRQKRVIAKGADKCRTVFSKLFSICRRLVTQKLREKGCIATLRMSIQYSRESKIAV